MPSRHTFTIEPIRKLICRYVGDGVGWCDPFAGENSPAEHTNDINPSKPTKHHLHAKEYSRIIESGLNGILYDPPYSNRQIKECYEGLGLGVTMSDTQSLFSKEKKMFASKIKVGGIAICFGWNSNGFGKNLGYELIEVLIVAHGGAHNDTIITVERKIQHELKL
jgi:hypothetical protein